MKQSQWIIAGGVLAVMVFVLTFASNFLGGRSELPQGGSQTQTQVAELTFAGGVVFPADGPPLETEERKPGVADFWFTNANDESLRVGLEKTTCKCSSVELYLLPDGQRLAAYLASMIGLGGQITAETQALLAVTSVPAWLPYITKDVKGRELLRDDAAVVAPGSVGWVRLGWNGTKPGNQPGLGAQLLVSSKTGTRQTDLAVRLVFHEALRVKQNPSDVGKLYSDEDLKAGVTRYLYCWSSTRSMFRLEVRLGDSHRYPGSDTIELGTPEPLNPDQLLALSQENNPPPGKSKDDDNRGTVRAGYRVPVRLRAMSSDNRTPFPIGVFNRTLKFTNPDEVDMSKEVVISGRVRSRWVEIGIDDSGDIDFGLFFAKKGVRKEIVLSSEVPGLDLRVDADRCPKWMEASVSRTRKQDERQTWQLAVKIPPDKVLGRFPNADDARYADCAAYLIATVKENDRVIERVIRISLRGNARSG